MALKQIILLMGKAQNGKTSTAKYLKMQLEFKGHKVLIIPFAKYLKLILKDYLDIDPTIKDEKFRTNAQYIGTDKIRKEMNKPLFHCNRVMEDIKIIEDSVEYVLIDDCRFKDEVYYSKACFPNQTMTIKVHRLGFESPLTKEQQKHQSEIDLDDFNADYNIYCQSDLNHLYDETDRMFKGALY